MVAEIENKDKRQRVTVSVRKGGKTERGSASAVSPGRTTRREEADEDLTLKSGIT